MRHPYCSFPIHLYAYLDLVHVHEHPHQSQQPFTVLGTAELPLVDHVPQAWYILAYDYDSVFLSTNATPNLPASRTPLCTAHLRTLLRSWCGIGSPDGAYPIS